MKLTKLQRNKEVDAEQYNKLVDEVNRINRIHTTGNLIVRNHSGGVDFVNQTQQVVNPYKYGRIVQSLSKGDVVLGTAERGSYLISLTLSKPASWFAGVVYGVGAIVSYSNMEYECVLLTTATTPNPEVATSYWAQNSNLEYVGVYHYEGDLLETIPWFQVDDTVLILQDESSSYQILETVTRVEYKKNEGTFKEERLYSIAWRDHTTNWGAGAVYA